jgi:hypothetical protein
MSIALKQDSDGGQDRSIIINDENARHGFPSDSARSTKGYIFLNS